MPPLPPDVCGALRAAMPAGALRVDAASRVTAGYDNSRRQVLPDAVAAPAGSMVIVPSASA